MYLRDFILEIGTFDIDLLTDQVNADYDYLSQIEVGRNSILSFLNLVPGLDFQPYDVFGALSSAAVISRINGDLQITNDQIFIVRDALGEVSSLDQVWFDAQIESISAQYQTDISDLPSFGAYEWFEGATGFTSAFFGNVADVTLGQLESIKDVADFITGSYGLITTVIFERDSIVDAALALEETILTFGDTLFDSLNDGFQVSDFQTVGEVLVDQMISAWDRMADDHLIELKSFTGDMVDVVTGDANVFTIGEKTKALFDGYNKLTSAGFSDTSTLRLLFGVQEDFWLTGPSVGASDLFDLFGIYLKVSKLGGEVADLGTYLAGSGGGQEFGGQAIADLTVQIKKKDLLEVVFDDLLPKLKFVLSKAGVPPQYVAGAQALSESIDVFLQAQEVNLVKDLSIAIDQLEVINDAVVGAYAQLTVVMENALSRLPQDWGNDIPLERFVAEGGDVFNGSDFAEQIHGSEKNDTINAEGGNDIVYGQAGNDRIAGGSGNDTIYGGGNDDEIYGGTGNDYIKGESGNDTIYGQDDEDEIYGDEGNDYLHGGYGNDTVYGGSGADTIRGAEGDDVLHGEQYNDTIYGDSGNDILVGGEAPDVLIGGPGSDVFVFGSEELVPNWLGLVDQIKDFNQGNNSGVYDANENDKLDLTAIIGAAYENGESIDDLVRLKLSQEWTFVTTALEVDPDGSAGPEGWTKIALLEGVTPGTPVGMLLNFDGGSVDPVETPDEVIEVRGRPGSWSITPISQTLVEDVGSISFLVTRPNTDQSETIYISTTVNQGSANDGDYDYWLNQPVTFAAGQDEFTVNININDDSRDEGIETFGLIIQSSPDQPASEYLAQATFSIIDDDLADEDPIFTENNDLVWIEPTGGTQYFDGLAGDDTAVLNLISWTGGINTTFSSGVRNFSSGADSMRFVGVENFFVIAGSGNDTLTTGDGNDGLFGGSGDDILNGGAGFDILDGGSGDDTFHNVGLGDNVAGGAGTDTVNFSLSAVTADLTIDLGTGEGAGGTWTGVEFVNGNLGSGNDSVTAGMQLGHIYGNGGSDSITLDYSGTLAEGRTASQISFGRSYDSNGRNQTVTLDDGTVITSAVNGFEHLNIIGTDGDDVIDGSAGSSGNGEAGNQLFGGAGNDVLTGGAGADVLDGGLGDDTFNKVGVGDIVVGGTGTDTVNFDLSSATEDLTINLLTSEGAGGSWTGVEFVNGNLGSGNDSVTAGMQLGHIYGNGGSDSITLDYSGTLADGRTASQISFGRSYDSNGRNQTVTLDDGTVITSAVNGFEHLNIIGTDGDDVIDGSAGSSGNGEAGNQLFGGAGNDVLTGGAGADVLDGGLGDDIFNKVGVGDIVVGDEGIDTVNFDLSSATENLVFNLVGNEGFGASWTGVEFANGNLGSGNDSVTAGMQLGHIYGNGGSDSITLDYSGTLADGRTASQISFGRNYDSNGRNQTVTLDDGTVITSAVNGFEHLNIIGTDGDDVIDGSAGSSGNGEAGNQLFGGAGNDVLTGGAGADVLDGGLGDDTFNKVGVGDIVVGGTGTDTVNFDLSSATEDLTINLLTSEGAGGSWTGVEFANGNLGSGNDSVTAGMQLGHIYGNGGSDSITLDYSGTLADGRTASQISFGRSYDSNGRNQTVTLDDGTVITSAVNGFEHLNIIGTDGDDVIDGSAGSSGNGEAGNQLFGGAGNDVLTGGAGADVLDGGLGDDTFNKVGVGDIVVGGTGTDTVNFDLSSATEDLTINLLTSEGAGGSWTGVEFANGNLGSGNDSVTAGMQLGHIYGNGGSDSITLDYSGTLADGRTASQISFGRSYDSNGRNQTVTLDDGTVITSAVNGFEHLNIIGTDGDDVIDGSAGSSGNGEAGNQLFGGAGNDVLTGGAGADVLDGGLGDDIFNKVGVGDIVVGDEGIDTVNFDLSSATENLVFNLVGNEGFGASWTGVEFANGNLGSGNDSVTAGMQLGHIYGNGGSDSITLDYSGTLADGRTASQISFGRSYDSNGRNQTVTLDDGTVITSAVNGFEHLNIIGTDGDDVIDGSAGSSGNGEAGNQLFGGAGNDVLTGGAGADVLDGGLGDDIFNKVGVGDIVVGGTGTDTVNFDLSSATEDLTINLLTSEGAGGSWTGVEFVNGNLGSGNDSVTAGMQLGHIYGNGGSDSITLDYSGTLAEGRTASQISFGRSYDSNGRNQTVTLDDGTVITSAVNGFEHLNIIGTDGDDVIDGSAGSSGNGEAGNQLFGGAGNDVLTGGVGADVLDGGLGDDIFNKVGVGDIVVGDEGIDTVNFDLSSATENLVFNLVGNEGFGASWTGVEFANGNLGSGNDSVTAGMQLGHIYGNGGSDSITLDYSGTLADGRTASQISFGRNYDSNGRNQTVTLNDGTLITSAVGGFEHLNIIGTDGDDVIDGSAGSSGNGEAGNQLFGGAGNDVLTGGAGNDSLGGGSGTDSISLGAGKDQVFGSLEELDSDRVTGFGLGKAVLVKGATVLSVSSILDGTDTLLLLDEDGDGTPEATLRLVGFRDATSYSATYADGNTTLIASSNLPPTVNPMDAGAVGEDGPSVSIDLLTDATAADSDGGTLGVSDVTVKDGVGNPVVFALIGTMLTIDPAQFAAALSTGDSLALSIVYKVTDGQGGITPNTGTLLVAGLDGPFTWYLDVDADGFGVDNVATNQSAYTQPVDTSAVAGDADDADGSVYPGALEINDYKDNDQDGAIDEDNSNPVADAEAFSVKQNGSLVIPVATLLAGDTDPDGDALTVTGVSGAVNGTAMLDDKGDSDFSNDEVVFKPDSGFIGEAIFDYEISDGFGGSATSKVDVTVTKAPIVIIGNEGADNLVGTDGPDVIISGAGSYDRMAGGGGADEFIFGEEARNGIRERSVILDYEVGVDSIVLINGASVGAIRQTSSSVVVFLEEDGDAIYVRGEGVTDENLTIFTEAEFDFS